MLQNGEIIGGMYQIIREIGKGGTGVIYLGYHLRLQKQIVIKRTKDNYTEHMNVRAEADILKRLHHTFLPQVYDFLVIGNGVYTVMDYIPGYDLQYYLDQNYRFPEKTLMLWLSQLCEVLEYLHSQDPPILHSDIKPGNIMITQQGNVCLIDFNISLDGTEEKKLQGISPHYAAPEQYRCAMDILYTGKSEIKLDERMDIYSLGAVFYRMMTGQLPNPEQGVPYPIEDMDIPYSEGLKSLISKAAAFLPGRRYRTAKQMGEALKRIERLDPSYRLLGRVRILTDVLCGLVFIIGILMIFGGVGVWQRESWQQAYSDLYLAVQTGNEPEIITEGTAMLNNYVLRGYMKSNPDEKAEVLYILGDSYYRQEQYGNAADYYKEALENSPNTLYLRDYMTAMARSGQSFSPLQIEAEYPEIDMDDAETRFVEAQLAYSSEEWNTAEEKAQQALSLSSSAELKARIYSLQAEICTARGDDAGALSHLRQAASIQTDRNILRKCGQTAFNAGNDAAADTTKRTYYEQALEFYEQLCTMDDPSYEDQLNRALVFRALGRYDMSNYCLREMRTQYSDDYRILMWFCYNCLDESAEGGEYGESSDLDFYYGLCCRAYEEQNVKDEDMEELIEIMKDLE